MMSWRGTAIALAAATALLAGCDRGADTGATANPNAPGQPGSGNSTEVRVPQAGDGPPGGPSGVAGSAPHSGGSGADVMPGTTGSGSPDGSRSHTTAQPGSGTTGGLGASTGSTDPRVMGAGSPASQGGSNRTSGGAMGER